jgi:hypothetical protein
MRMTLDAKGFREQALGKWSTYAGGCYYAFADDNLMNEEYKVDPSLPILFGFDFNVDWYSIVVAQYKDDVFHVFDEVRLANSNTRAALDVLVAKFGGMSRQYIAYGDAAGRQRQTSADISDYLIIEAEKRIPEWCDTAMPIPSAYFDRPDDPDIIQEEKAEYRKAELKKLLGSVNKFPIELFPYFGDADNITAFIPNVSAQKTRYFDFPVDLVVGQLRITVQSVTSGTNSQVYLPPMQMWGT